MPDIPIQSLITGLLDQFTDPSKRLFWVFILTSSLMALGYLWVSGEKLTWHKIRATFFARRYWLTASSATDIGLLSLNSLIKILLLVPLFGSHLLGAIWVGGLLQGQLGTPMELALPAWCIAILFTLCFFVAEDFSRYALHRCMHRFPLLWHFHQLHHSAKILTPLTLHRVHPVEMGLYFLRGWLVFSLVSGIFLYLAGSKLTALQILGVDALGFLFNAVGANLRHSQIPIHFGKFENWFISPAQHQIHHSSALEHRDKNFGTCLALWDKMGDSWVKGRQKAPIRFGLISKN